MSKEFDLLFVGPDSVLKEYFRDIADGYSFREAADGSNSLQQVGSGDSKSEIVVLWEKTTIDRDLSAIRAFRKTRGNVYLILIGNELTPDERSGYLKAGVNDTMLRHIPKEQFVSRLSFIQQTREMILGKREKASQEAICHFRLPLWKRLFDICFSSVALLSLSPLLLLTMLAMRLESKGAAVYRSKRVGSNYRVFDFLKFRSMYAGAEKQLKHYEQLNQYKFEKTTDEDGGKLNISGDFLVGDDDVVLVSDETGKRSADYAGRAVHSQIQHRRTSAIDQYPERRYVRCGEPSAAVVRSRTADQRRIYRPFYGSGRADRVMAGREAGRFGQYVRRRAEETGHRICPGFFVRDGFPDNLKNDISVRTKRKCIVCRKEFRV